MFIGYEFEQRNFGECNGLNGRYCNAIERQRSIASEPNDANADKVVSGIVDRVRKPKIGFGEEQFGIFSNRQRTVLADRSIRDRSHVDRQQPIFCVYGFIGSIVNHAERDFRLSISAFVGSWAIFKIWQVSDQNFLTRRQRHAVELKGTVTSKVNDANGSKIVCIIVDCVRKSKSGLGKVQNSIFFNRHRIGFACRSVKNWINNDRNQCFVAVQRSVADSKGKRGRSKVVRGGTEQ